MNLKDISSLIEIRDYIERTINNYSLAKSSVAELKTMLILLDKKIVTLLIGEESKNPEEERTSPLKEFLNYAETKDAATREAAINSSIKSGLKR